MLHIVNKIKEKPKFLFICVGLLLLLLCIFLNFIYRPYAYSRHLSDFHISDSYTSFLGVPMGVCCIQGCLRAHKKQSIVGSILESMLILIGFEFVDAFFTKNNALKSKKQQNDALILSFKWLWQSLALSGIDREKRKTQIDEIETLSNHYLAETSNKKERTYKKQ